ncbi:CubicO group peptidase (beta-lactamase class C family) [Aquimarina sp. MAR_2010_214]|uniref:serine hydrolase domain-containing protein n=1 Tax=Aquimarina sp. MAR_2010_214 TaxID=1250026 RepID=UPI000C6FEE49|nr:serine hydrolase domain-containing protein [Aquimarina sp. MAR_2010_214]PKV50393.1 CubicO group peptidase (beta-lactamase class C family) [Aquimarina sp. MAR_2010_214]
MRHSISKSVLILLLPLMTSFFLSCSSDDESVDKVVQVTDTETLSKRLEQILDESDFPGFTVGIAKNGNPSFQQSYGYKDISSNSLYDNQTLQPIGSISKTFIGVATVKAIELGLFTLETPINDILDQPIVNPKNNTVDIKVKHLVSHTSGLVDTEEAYVTSYYILPNENVNTTGGQLLVNEGIIQRQSKSLKEFIEAYYYESGDYYSADNFSNNAPGTNEQYSNIASSLMAYLIEKASSISYREFVQENIFKPLKMFNTTFSYQEPLNHFATLYRDVNTPLPFYDLESYPDGSVKISNQDMMKYIMNMIKGRRGESTTLFSKASYELLFSEVIPSSSHTIFWDLENNGDLGHDGGDYGLTTELSFNGSHNSGFFILTNYDTSDDAHERYYAETAIKIKKAIISYINL